MCVCVCVFVCVHLHIYAFTCVYVCVYIYIYIIYIYIYTYIWIYIFLCIYMYTYIGRVYRERDKDGHRAAALSGEVEVYVILCKFDFRAGKTQSKMGIITFIHTCMHESKLAQVPHICFCMYTFIHVYTHIHTYIHTYKQDRRGSACATTGHNHRFSDGPFSHEAS
jgi:hypothetical protein